MRIGRVFGRRSPSNPREASVRLSQILTASLVLLCGGAARAHEIGTTRVAVLIHDDKTYDVEIVTDATALAEKLDASAGASLPPGITADGLQTILTSFDERFRQRIKL